ncbi:nucleoside-diphosphate-sugar epimerase [Arthrobacter sp. SLBN-112]|jgi:nucleoside-diphosphate-sugar epimerase|uniref:NAD-dependent epimerase/dehydratase family protein n=1 Tax=Arthrobacter sp. SLBN-112 TaxID=2768452 RepID=UPI001150A2B9|nr:NAD-dependent epimerase/dehydratase family protein [Arthrobacter sp. SLBN-112]TQJ41263.1 nucleoside-diphosphate-sugar epimerase [Arthrobacter sp. SLBN-112]
MRILILGGTVFLSREIASQAVAAGHDVTCLARGTSGEPPQGAHWVSADRSRGPAAYPEVAGEWDAVIEVARDPEPARQALAGLAEKAAHWTFVSSCSAYADHSVPGAAEGAELLPALAPAQRSTPENYGESKVAIEEATLDATNGRAHLCRAGLISGPGDPTDRYGYWPARFARNSKAVLVPDIGHHPTQVIDVRDLAAWILLAAEEGITGPLNAMGDQVSFAELISACRAASGANSTIITAGEEWLAEHGVNYWSGPESLPLWLPPGHDGFMARSNRAARAAGMVLRPWQETLADTLGDERIRGLDRPRKAGLSPATERRLVEMLHNGGGA